MTPVPWDPVGSYGCGNPYDCPLCTARVLAERDRAHERRVANTRPRWTEADQVNAWLGEAYGTAADRFPDAVKREAEVMEAVGAVRVYFDEDARERVRVQRTLSEEHETYALGSLKGHPVRRCYLRRSATGRLTRKEWTAECWLELVNPSVLVGRRERSMSVGQKVTRAISRAERRMERAAAAEARDRA